MAMLVLGAPTANWTASCCGVESAVSTSSSTQHPSLQRTKLQRNPWRIACARTDHAAEWRRECSELRFEMQELTEALGDAWMQDEMNLLELEGLVSALVNARTPARNSSDFTNSEARARQPTETNFAVGRDEDEASEIASEIAKPDLEGEDEHYRNAIILSELRSDELRAKQEGVSTLRRLKHLNVHEYVHSALQASHLRSWLNSREILE